MNLVASGMMTDIEGGSALSYVLRGRVLRRNLVIALVVGCVLSLANQLDVVLTSPFTLKLGMKILFNFLVPFVVASVSSAMNRASR